MYRLSRERDDIKLFFLGTEHPDSGDAPTAPRARRGRHARAIRMCEELGILDKFVFFNFDWVDYDDTANYLLEADIGVCTYFDNLETRYAFRSRVLDLLWAELPIICTEGDVLAELVASRPLGIAVAERDEVALVERHTSAGGRQGVCRGMQEEPEAGERGVSVGEDVGAAGGLL